MQVHKLSSSEFLRLHHAFKTRDLRKVNNSSFIYLFIFAKNLFEEASYLLDFYCNFLATAMQLFIACSLACIPLISNISHMLLTVVSCFP